MRSVPPAAVPRSTETSLSDSWMPTTGAPRRTSPPASVILRTIAAQTSR